MSAQNKRCGFSDLLAVVEDTTATDLLVPALVLLLAEGQLAFSQRTIVA